MKILFDLRFARLPLLLLVFSMFSVVNIGNGQEAADSLEQPAENNQDSIDELRQQGSQFVGQEKWKEAIAIFERIVKEDPGNGRDWQLLGYSLHLNGELDKAIEIHKKAAEFTEFEAISFFNLGCAYSLKNDLDQSFEYLRKCIDANFDRVAMIESDEDLANARKDPRFKKLLAYSRGELDDTALVGDWKFLSGNRSGNEVPAERMPPLINITADTITLPSPDGGEPFVISYKMDSSKTPITIDFEIESGPVSEGKAAGILKLVGDKLTICYDPTAEKRPEKFATTEENGCFKFVLQKTTTEKKDSKPQVGKWSLISGTRAGNEVEAANLESQVEFGPKLISLPAGPTEKFVMSYQIDETKSPMTIDMKIEEGPAPIGSPAVGIISIEGDSMTLCYNAEGATRPEKFESTEENGYFLFKLKRASLETDKDK